jgi:hypothetical protein
LVGCTHSENFSVSIFSTLNFSGPSTRSRPAHVGSYVDYDANSGSYFLNDEQALCLADPKGPVDLPGAYMVVQDQFHVLQRAITARPRRYRWLEMVRR